MPVTRLINGKPAYRLHINPRNIRTQIRVEGSRAKGFRSLVLLSLLVFVAFLALVSLSQMAIEEHHVLGMLSPRHLRPTMNLRGGGVGRVVQRLLKGSKYSQFKIEPLLNREAPTVEVNLARTFHQRNSRRMADLILAESLSVFSHQSTRGPEAPRSKLKTKKFTRRKYVSKRNLNIVPLAQTNGLNVQSTTSSKLKPSEEKIDAEPNSLGNKRLLDRRKILSFNKCTPENKNCIGKDLEEIADGNLYRSEGVKTATTEIPAATISISQESTPAIQELMEILNSQLTGIEKDVRINKDTFFTEMQESKKYINSKDLRGDFKNDSQVLLQDDADDSFTENESLVDSEVTGVYKEFVDRISRKFEVTQKMLSCFDVLHRLSDEATKTDHCWLDNFESISNEKVSFQLNHQEINQSKTSPKLFDANKSKNNSAAGKLLLDTSPLLSFDKIYTKKVLLQQEDEDDLYKRLTPCPAISPNLKGRQSISVPRLEEVGMAGLLHNLSWVNEGGSWSPIYDPIAPCVPRHRVGVIIPYRDRVQHLALMLSWLHPLLRRQQLEYTVYVAEQVGNTTFNKGALMNAGFLEVFTKTNTQCFVFHDVDLLSEDDRNMYSCPPVPRHLSVGVDTLHYKLPYFLLVGGVMAVTGEHFLKLNGYSNMYWGWGGEDDDMGYRMMQSGLGISRPPYDFARYSMIRHIKRKPLIWKIREKLVRTSAKRYRLDGLNTVKYSSLRQSLHPLYTHLLLDVGTPPEGILRMAQQ